MCTKGQSRTVRMYALVNLFPLADFVKKKILDNASVVVLTLFAN